MAELAGRVQPHGGSARRRADPRNGSAIRRVAFVRDSLVRSLPIFLSTTSRKSSRLPGSLLTKSPFHNRSERFGFSDLDLICRFFSDLEDFCDDLPVSHLKYNALDDFQEVFQMSSRKTSSKSRLDFLEVFLPGLPFITDLRVLVFNQMVLIFHSFKDLDLDMQVFQICKTYGMTYLLVV
ncbi:hypothetical protein F2Q70_00035899 [Brassica cretica]|uniref:Uncharacterized protein n=1 Tax=Brassica cretica TaxID=69181 RepID=A0A8S9JTE0_BRACR|nr:hypothetical protein F2Q70_00035899 [Brassica cretica]